MPLEVLVAAAEPWERVKDENGVMHLVAPALPPKPLHVSVVPDTEAGETAQCFHRVGVKKHLAGPKAGTTEQVRWPIAELTVPAGAKVRLYIEGHRLVLTTRDFNP